MIWEFLTRSGSFDKKLCQKELESQLICQNILGRISRFLSLLFSEHSFEFWPRSEMHPVLKALPYSAFIQFEAVKGLGHSKNFLSLSQLHVNKLRAEKREKKVFGDPWDWHLSDLWRNVTSFQKNFHSLVCIYPARQKPKGYGSLILLTDCIDLFDFWRGVC